MAVSDGTVSVSQVLFTIEWFGWNLEWRCGDRKSCTFYPSYAYNTPWLQIRPKGGKLTLKSLVSKSVMLLWHCHVGKCKSALLWYSWPENGQTVFQRQHRSPHNDPEVNLTLSVNNFYQLLASNACTKYHIRISTMGLAFLPKFPNYFPAENAGLRGTEDKPSFLPTYSRCLVLGIILAYWRRESSCTLIPEVRTVTISSVNLKPTPVYL